MDLVDLVCRVVLFKYISVEYIECLKLTKCNDWSPLRFSNIRTQVNPATANNAVSNEVNGVVQK